ncbi:MAG: 50S ribosomal protein LX [Hadesarchaea archaeon DG-33-1]|nr:MAG: 50S ribosomal protein LX [Hadesarchaea archaeon DG-33-1]
MIKIFRVKGWFKQGYERQTFTREFPAISEKQALERIYSEVGSKHKVKRNLINIEEVTEIKPEEVKDPRVTAMLR